MRRALLLASLLPQALSAAAFGSAGTAGADFSKILGAARPAAMGGAGTALGQDLGSLGLNPAALSGLAGFQAEAAHVSWLEGVALDHAVLAWGRRQGLSAALSYLQLGTPDMEGIDANGAALGAFRQRDASLALQLAKPLGRVDLGLGLRGLQRQLAGLSQSGVEADLGARVRLGGGWALALSTQHLGTISPLESHADPLPGTLRAGVAWERSLSDNIGASFALDGVQAVDSAVQLRAGAEMRIYHMLALRAGSQFSEAFDGRQAFTAGLGLAWQGLGLDYAWAPFGVLGNTHRIGLRWNGAARREEQARARPQPKAAWLQAQREGPGVVLSWDGSAAPRWALYLKKSRDSDLVKVAETAGDAPKVRLKRIAAGSDVVFAVAPLDPLLGEGERSHQLTLPPERAQIRQNAPPSPPRNLRVVKADDRARLSWDAPQEGAQGMLYQAYVSNRHDGGFKPLGGVNSLSERSVDLKDQKRRLYFSVRARRAEDDALLSDWSPTVSIAP